jgi:hypothetical protein
MTELKPRKDKVVIFLLCLVGPLVLIGLLIKNLIEGYNDFNATATLVIAIVFILFISPPIVLSITYLFIDLTKKIIIDKNNIVIIKRAKHISINHEDVIVSFYVKVDDFFAYTRYNFPMFKYIVLILKERKKVFITNLLCDPELIIKTLELDNKMILTPFPFLNPTLGNGVLTSKEYEKKVQEFEKLFQQNTNAMLAEIINNKNTYADYAREAATRLLNSRKH